ncbi:substrate-binding domain-containing protein [Streptomyces sp. NPDC060209]|uniref:substrate-binding domain-containing protein n=1 Tax=Streptomyces sp. NPDC060209 TaxID=3347073 RepID=UPI0036500DB7
MEAIRWPRVGPGQPRSALSHVIGDKHPHHLRARRSSPASLAHRCWAGAWRGRIRCRPPSPLCANDLLALGVLQALFDAGLCVPEDMALVGYDDIEYASSATVPLTSLQRPGRTTGATAVRLLEAKTTLPLGE